jgi:hypothetical protein
MWRRAGVALAAALVAASVATGLHAQPSPPNRFFGNLTIDGMPGPAGTSVRAFIAGKDCTTPRDPFPVPAGQYALEVAHTSQIPGCGTPGAEIQFRIGDRVANEVGIFVTGEFTRLDLTFTARPAATPTPAPAPQPAFYSLARLNLDANASRCIPLPGETVCDALRQALWMGDLAAWRQEQAARGLPEPTADDAFLLTYEFRIANGDPPAIASIARGLGWPKIYITAIRFRGTLPGEGDEYVEVTNVGGAAQDMTGWRVRAVESGTDFFFTDGSVLEPGATCRFYTNVIRPDSCPGTVNVATAGVWDDLAGSAELWYDPFSIVFDATRYSADPDNQPPPPNLQGVREPVG